MGEGGHALLWERDGRHRAGDGLRHRLRFALLPAGTAVVLTSLTAGVPSAGPASTAAFTGYTGSTGSTSLVPRLVSSGFLAVPRSRVSRLSRPSPPSARDVAESKETVRQRAVAVGRIKARLVTADSELDRLGGVAAAALERYHGEMTRLARAKQDHALAVQRLAAADHGYEAARAELAGLAAQAFQARTSGNPFISAVAGDGGPQGFMDRAGLLELIGRRQNDATHRLEAARTVAGVFRRRAEHNVLIQHEATEFAAQAERDIRSAVDRQQAAVREIATQKAELVRQLGQAQARALELQRQRAEALARARAARLARLAGGGQANAAALLAGDARRGAIVARAALRWLGTRYSWGGGTTEGPSYGIAQGAGIRGFDCSGLALYAWAKVGVRLDHWTGTQWTSGPHVPTNLLRPGDLVFFAHNTNDPDTIHHVGIYIGEGRMVEAPYTGARVRISSIWRNGFIGATRPV